MRNLSQYPPNVDEAVQILTRIKAQTTKTAYPGDLSGLYLDKAIQFIQNNHQEFAKHLEQHEWK